MLVYSCTCSTDYYVLFPWVHLPVTHQWTLPSTPVVVHSDLDWLVRSRPFAPIMLLIELTALLEWNNCTRPYIMYIGWRFFEPQIFNLLKNTSRWAGAKNFRKSFLIPCNMKGSSLKNFRSKCLGSEMIKNIMEISQIMVMLLIIQDILTMFAYIVSRQ